MTLLEAIPLRHSVRRYKDIPLGSEIIKRLQDEIARLNLKGGLHMQLILNEPKAFTGLLSYGKFSGVKNYVVVAGPRTSELEEKCGYYGEELVLYAQTLGLNTCWVGLSYRKVADTYTLDPDEKIVCYIAIGYGETQGSAHKTKTIEQLSNVSADTPEWFHAGMEAVRLAPSAINQQKYYFRFVAPDTVVAERRFSLAGYTKVDLGIARRHLELGAGKAGFK